MPRKEFNSLSIFFFEKIKIKKQDSHKISNRLSTPIGLETLKPSA